MGGGGVTGGQMNTAAGNLSGIGRTGATNMGQQYGQMLGTQNQVTPFYTSQMNNGLPFYRNMADYNQGTMAQAFAPQRAALLRGTSQYTNLPSGYRDALMTNLASQQGRAFDATQMQAAMANQMAKQQGAAGLTGEEQIAGNQALGYGSLGANANQAVLQAPQRPSPWGTVGGLALGAANTAAAFA